MFGSSTNYGKLKTNLRLCISRLKLLEKKKAELCQKARKEIADYIATNKVERAKIRVEYIIREDYLVEAMEVVEMYCDLILARFGLLQQMKNLDEGLSEAVSSLIWVAPRMQSDVAELKVVAEQLGYKYGKQYAQSCHENEVKTVSEKLMHKLSVQSPPKILVENYLIEIAKSHGVPYEPDPLVMKQEREKEVTDDNLLNWNPDNMNDLSGGDENNGGGGSGFVSPSFPSAPGFKEFPPPPLPSYVMPPLAPDKYPDLPPPFPSNAYNIPPMNPRQPPGYDDINKIDPPFDPNAKGYNIPHTFPKDFNLPELPTVPGDVPSGTKQDDNQIDFDDLTKRFENLKKKK